MRDRLSDHDRERIDTAIAEIEQRERVEIALVVTPASDRYVLYPLAWAALVALTVAALIAVFRPRLPLALGLLIQLGALIAFAIVFALGPLRLMLVPKRVRDHCAAQLAHREFAAHALAGSDERAVILFFASFGERYFEVIGNRAAHARIAENGWNAIVAEFIESVRRKGIAAALVAALARCRAILSGPEQ